MGTIFPPAKGHIKRPSREERGIWVVRQYAQSSEYNGSLPDSPFVSHDGSRATPVSKRRSPALRALGGRDFLGVGWCRSGVQLLFCGTSAGKLESNSPVAGTIEEALWP
jgi:hypothetical protein